MVQVIQGTYYHWVVPERNEMKLFAKGLHVFDLSDKVFQRFQSYLEKYSQRVAVHGTLSDALSLLSGVSQG